MKKVELEFRFDRKRVKFVLASESPEELVCVSKAPELMVRVVPVLALLGFNVTETEVVKTLKLTNPGARKIVPVLRLV